MNISVLISVLKSLQLNLVFLTRPVELFPLQCFFVGDFQKYENIRFWSAGATFL